MERPGIVWYTPEQWKQMKKIAVDHDRLEESYEDWLQIAKEAEQNLEKQGILTQRVFVNANEFYNYCAIIGIPLDASSRSQFVSKILVDRQKK